MRCPRKLYIVVSKKAPNLSLVNECEVFTGCREAALEASARNILKTHGADDWRVETFVKGD